MKKITLLASMIFLLSACSVTESIYLNDTRAQELERYGYSTSETSNIVVKNCSESQALMTVVTSEYTRSMYRVQPGEKMEFKIKSGTYQVDTENYVFTEVDSRLGYDIEFLPGFEYKTKLE